MPRKKRLEWLLLAAFARVMLTGLRPVVPPSLQHGEAVFVSLWANWCPFCRAEMPGIEALYQKADKSNGAFVMLSQEENPARAQRFLKSLGYTFPLYSRAG